MEVIKKEHSILEDYTLSETTLEQVFLSFAQRRDRPTSKVSEITDTGKVSETTESTPV